ncbi:NAD(P)-binding domain-containing protein [Streptosporangium sandarakinum]|uniref:3-hydroxyisobutyrate dehydrogenase-like beta-hydroxyacid dehydrogenase/enamine deaminase RidA (YjgF/YER057c/UK114 family) n=1 Tax=Streptosporangium sandarakinum TaxID=1260955 RepID=A0A852VA37_9ACTN|nr:NAD(P)-binding domain-containing protein [Streptosporangium sandarakinum]NYF43944.1 3-hydroxyisobutyrate dehydrogenase-like beta-hydroxyacid dehydrogenase/enamine deaminase RidA (YjgF/YER057c/UK114 family) [Streptosporangium sandarakinum]
MIAFLGLGRMGAPMTGRLVAAGYKVTVWNRTPRAPEGATVAGSPAAAVAEAELVITMLSDPEAVRRVLTEALPGLRPGTLVVEMSTIGPEAVAGLRELLPAKVGLVDAPVLGSVEPARDGTLTVLAGGAPEDLARCREVLEVFGRVREAGGPGAGAALKVAVMSALVPAQVLLAETLARAEAGGVDAGALLDVLGGTPLGGLVERVRPAVENGPPGTRYALGLAAKDLTLASPGAGTIAAAARDRLLEAAAAGLGGADLTAVFGHLRAAGRTEERAGTAGEPARSRGVAKVNPASVPATNGRYSHATKAAGLLFVSGQVALDGEGRVVGEDDMTRQSEHVMELLARILADQGCTFDDVTHIRTHLTDMSRLLEYAAVRGRYITGEPPASTTVEVSRLFRPGLLIEVEVIAALPAER